MFFVFVYTESDTKLLYCVIFLFKISAHNPKTRSKRALSSLMHLSGPLRHATVAALGLSNSKAISPVKII